MTELEPGEWLVGLASWVIQDGNYPDFAVGERRRFALEFACQELAPSAAEARSARSLGEGLYDITAQVVYAGPMTEHERLAVIDFGLLAYSDFQPRIGPQGTWWSGRASLEVDCFEYFEDYANRAGVPAAVYTWAITGIWRETAPFVAVPGYLKVMQRDPAQLGYTPLGRTNAWTDDDGHAEYLLRCRLESDQPVRHP